ncbi:MAG: tetratricopeptide repeat protein [Hyphomicrobiales bacterium]|nr:tetratricopeptide repeat protein [Hyphomicrobiales bacterium]
MRIPQQSSLWFSLLLCLCALPPVVFQANAAQGNAAWAKPDTSDQQKRQKAVALFGEGKRLEALPLLEELVQENPQDAELLVDLGASLIEHAATLTDREAAAKERFRARDLVQKAWQLGNASPLAENLRQLLRDLPANGAIRFSNDPAVERAMEAGEAAFARHDFEAALRAYAKALELEPTNYSAALFTANSYDRKNDFTRAGEWYERAMRLDPDIETAYRYYADMLAKQGDMAKARGMLIQAAMAEPYNKIVWREIRAWALINKTAFKLVYLPIPLVAKDDASIGASGQAPQLLPAWRAYHSVIADWRKGGKFQKQFPQEAAYRHSLPEESEALTAAAVALQPLRQDENGAELLADNTVAGLLRKLHEAGLIDPYVLFSLGDSGIARDYKAYRAANRNKLEEYLDKFVMPPPPAGK